MKLRNLLISCAFLVIIGAGFLNQIFRVIPDLNYKENRKKAEKLVADINYLDRFPQEYNAYYKDHFSFRGVFLSSFGWMQEKLFKKATNPDKVILGKNDWLYNVDKELNAFSGKSSLSQEQLEAISKELEYRQTVLDSMGIKMLVVINPTKYSVYPEYLPILIQKMQEKGLGEQLVYYLRANTSVNLLESKQILMPLKDSLKLFLKADNHWTGLAGYYVGREILKKIDPSLSSIPVDDFCRDTTYNRIGNLASMLGNAIGHAEDKIDFFRCNNDAPAFEQHSYPPPDRFAYKSEYQMSYRSVEKNAPDALIIRDSFGHMLVPYLKNAFYHSTFIWDNWEYGFNMEIIKQEQPDVVIYSILESLIPNLYEKGLSVKEAE